MAKAKIATIDATGTDAEAALSAALAELERASAEVAELRRLRASADPDERERAVNELPGAERDLALAEVKVMRARQGLDAERAKHLKARQRDAAAAYDETLTALDGLYAQVVEAVAEADRRFEICQGLGVRREPPGRPPRTEEDYRRWRSVHGL